jgi:hypothetical protein
MRKILVAVVLLACSSLPLTAQDYSMEFLSELFQCSYCSFSLSLFFLTLSWCRCR